MIIKNKRGNAFNIINAGMISFIGFMLIVLLTIVMVTSIKQTNAVCPTTYAGGQCLTCQNTSYGYYNTSNCCWSGATCTGGNLTATVAYSGAAYNATLLMGQAAQLPGQFAQIIVIVMIIVGILAMLSMIGYNVYNKMKK